MWLLPLFSPVARAAAHIYYRVRFDGAAVPADGPVLLVANHPNSLLDPTLVVAAANRPVRFLAKAPLFSDRKIGWLVRAAGAIPVYRKADDPALMDRNAEAFSAVFVALAAGSAVGIFPEGTSHSAPAMAPLRTGAARIALGAASVIGRAFHVVPVGLSFRDKDVFRSSALVVRGEAVSWADLAHRGADDGHAVRELTDRIEAALRTVTVNLGSWEDRPLVEMAVRIWEAETGERSEAGERISRMELTTRLLARVRATEDAEGLALAQDVASHARRLARLGLRPADLCADTRAAVAVRWAARRLHLVLPFWGLVAAVSAALFWVPYRLTGTVVDRLGLEEDVRSTWKLLVGVVLYAAWLVMIVVGAGLWVGWLAALVTVVAVPVSGIAGLLVRERWRAAWDDARRFFLLRARRPLVASLAGRQHELAVRLHALVQRTGG